MTKKLKEPLAAPYLGVSVHTLQKWRRTGKGPAFYRVGRAITYDVSDLDAFLEANKFTSTSQYGGENDHI